MTTADEYDFSQLETAVREATREVRRRTRLQRAGLLILGVLAVAGIYWKADRAQEAIDQANSERAARTVTSCDQQATFSRAHNRLVLDLAGIDPDSGHPTSTWTDRTPEQLDAIRPRLQRNLLPLRICTPEAIAAYFQSGGRDGVQPIDPTGDDYSEAVTVP